MKKLLALLLAVLLLMGLAACGEDRPNKDDASAFTTKGAAGSTESTMTTTHGDVTASTTDASQPADSAVSTAPSATEPSGSTGSSAVTTTTTTTTTITSTTTTTTATVPGVTVPIGTKPPVTTTTTGTAPTTGSTGSTAPSTSTTTTTSTTTSTTTTTKPTEPEGPYIVLPAVGSDIDVTGKKNRILVSAVAAWFNEDGTIGVSLTFKNSSKNWITEETNYVTYSCYDKDGKVIERNTKLPIGVIDTKKNPERTYVFEVPAETAEVRITGSKIVYWTEWA